MKAVCFGLCLCFGLCASACGDDAADDDTGSDADADGDSDGDSDADGDSDTDSDADGLDCDGGRYDQAAGLCWQHPQAADAYEWQAAIDYCDGLDLAGHTDWVLPSKDDFIALLGGCEQDVLDGDYGYCDSCDDSETCFALFGSDNDRYWSSTPYSDNIAWYAELDHGGVSHIGVSNANDVRCVRVEP